MDNTPSPIVGIPGLPDNIVAPEPKAQSSITKYTSNALRDPESAINFMDEDVQFRLKNHLRLYPDLFSLNERELLDRCRTIGYVPGPNDNLLRHRLWVEYDFCSTGSLNRIRTPEIVRSVCSQNYFINSFLLNPHKSAWLLLPPITYQVKQEETLYHSLNILRDVLDLPHVDASGKINSALIKTKMGIYQMMEKRVHGETVQKHLNINVPMPEEPLSITETTKAIESMTEAELTLEVEKMLKKKEKTDKKRAFDQAAASDIFLTTGTKVND